MSEQLTPRDRAIARAMMLTHEMNELRRRMRELFPERREAFRVLHADFRMSLRDIGNEIGISGPRVHEIIEGNRPRKARDEELCPEWS